MIRPHPLVQIGAVYRTPLSASISGTGARSPSARPRRRTGLRPRHHLAAVGRRSASPSSRTAASSLSAQADWTAWSSIQKLDARSRRPHADASEMRYMDTYAIHAGVQGVITRFLVLRVGGTFDSNAIPDRTLRRENQDDAEGHRRRRSRRALLEDLHRRRRSKCSCPARRASSRRRCRTRSVPKTRQAPTPPSFTRPNCRLKYVSDSSGRRTAFLDAALM